MSEQKKRTRTPKPLGAAEAADRIAVELNDLPGAVTAAQEKAEAETVGEAQLAIYRLMARVPGTERPKVAVVLGALGVDTHGLSISTEPDDAPEESPGTLAEAAGMDEALPKGAQPYEPGIAARAARGTR